MRVLVIGSSGGIGAALGAAYAARGAKVRGVSRRDDGLDLTDEASIERTLDALEGPFDRIFVATGALELQDAPPEKSLRALSAEAMAGQFTLNAAGPALVLKHALRLMPRDADCRFAALSARVGSIGDNRLGGWYAYRASKAALHQLMRTFAAELAPDGLVFVLLSPGWVRTDMGGPNADVDVEASVAGMRRVIADAIAWPGGGFYDYRGQSLAW